MESFGEHWRRQATRKSLLTAMAFDALGSALEPYSPKQRVNWFGGERVMLKRNARRVGTFNTQFMLLLLQTLAFTNPIEEDMCKEYESDLKSVLGYYVEQVNQSRTHNRYILMLRGAEDTGISISVGMAIGYYGAMLGGTFEVLPLLESLCDSTASAVRLKSADRKDAYLYAVNIARLVRAGYFCAEHLEELVIHGVVPKSLDKFVKHLIDEHDNPSVFEGAFKGEHSNATTQAQKVLAEVFYYMCRVNLQHGSKEVPSTPRQQLPDIFGSPLSGLTDLAFVYGGVCTASEQNHTLLPNTYRENVGGAELVDELFNYVWPIV